MTSETSTSKLDVVAARLDLLLRTIAAVTLIVMVLHVVANALARQARSPIEGTNEYTAYWYLPIIAFIGMYLAAANGTHIEARLLFDRFPRRIQIEAQVLGMVLTAALFAGFAWYGWAEAMEGAYLEVTGGTSDVPIWPVAFIVPLTCALVVIHLLVGIVRVIRRRDPDAMSGPTAADSEGANPISEGKI